MRYRATAIVVHEQKILSFFAIDPVSGKEFHFLPGGGIEEGEDPVDAAKRETYEETGYKVEIIPETELIKNYQFFWKSKTYNCLTHFYKAKLVSEVPEQVFDAAYNKGVRWVPISDIKKAFFYSNEILAAVLTLSNWRTS